MVRDGRSRRLDYVRGAVMALAGIGMLGWGTQGLLASEGGNHPVGTACPCPA
jgi:hypothetical protein